VRVQGDTNRLKALLAAGIPVLVETWYEPKPNDGMGHYRLIVGYDDAGKYWIAYDSYDSHGIKRGDPYQGIRLDYKSFDQLWKVFNRTYIPIYDEGRAAAVEAVLGADMDTQAMHERSLARNLAAVKANPKDNFAWFNAGSDYVALGNYEAAAKAYDTARRLKLPWRMLWYQFGPFEAYYNVGRHKEVISLADATIKTAVNDEELFYWKGLAQQALGDIAAAKASLSQAVKLRASYVEAVNALAAIE
jgi:tetratricopeptide (TPR) repeat protein